MQLIEVWIALKEAGYLNHVVGNVNLANHRQAFFEQFQLTDREYSSRRREIKNRKQPIAKFLSELVQAIEN